MITKIPDRCLTMSSYSAFLSLRQYLNNHPKIDPEEAISAVSRINSDLSNLDYIGGLMIYEQVGANVQYNDPIKILRFIIKELVRINQPWWLRLAPSGREKVRDALNQDQIQCFREAGLFASVPDKEVIDWWDEIALAARGILNAENLAMGREAEKLSFEYEQRRLKQLGVEKEPVWMSLEDNTVGYDIKSYDIIEDHLVTKLIEVKGAQSDIVYVTRNEWDNAMSAGDCYLFHIWKMPHKKLIKVHVPEMNNHIPTDNGSGNWLKVKIILI